MSVILIIISLKFFLVLFIILFELFVQKYSRLIETRKILWNSEIAFKDNSRQSINIIKKSVYWKFNRLLNKKQIKRIIKYKIFKESLLRILFDKEMSFNLDMLTINHFRILKNIYKCHLKRNGKNSAWSLKH